MKITKKRPAAVESAAAKTSCGYPSPMTQAGKSAISGFANTIISLSMVNHFFLYPLLINDAIFIFIIQNCKKTSFLPSF